MNHILLIDCDDSFTYNIFSEFRALKSRPHVDVRAHHELSHFEIDKYRLIVFGPGPGHPKDYVHLYHFYKKIRHQKKVLGICLGHQVILNCHGFEICQDENPIHGQAVEYELSLDGVKKYAQGFQIEFPRQIKVQRYNSHYVQSPIPNDISLTCEVQNKDVFWTYGHMSMTMQFHPESVGTRNRRAYFQLIEKWMLS